MKQTKYFATLALALASLTSCSSDFLEQSPTTSISQQMVETKLDAMNTILQGVHSMMYTYSFGDQYMTSGQPAINIHLDMLGDDVINTLPAIWMNYYRWEDHTNTYGTLNYYCWDYYSTINQHLNQVLDGALKYKAKESEIPLLHKILGEAYALRAWSNFNLVQLFGKRYVKGAANDSYGIIIRDTPSYDPKPRSTVAESYDFINKDINKAMELLKVIPDNHAKNSMRYATACGIAARIALTQQEWEKAEQYAAEAIAKSGAKLQVGETLVNGFNDWNADEWIWAYHQASSQDKAYNYFFADFSYNFEGKNSGLKYAVNRSLYDAMGEHDVRRKWWVCADLDQEPPTDAASTYFNNNSPWEYTGQSIKFKAKGRKSSYGDVVIMRLAELYYIKAEAEAHLHKDEEARKTLNTIMVTRDPEYNTSLSGDELLQEILRNKRIDLWEEGQRFFDMKRLGCMPQRLKAANFEILKKVIPGMYQRAVDRNSGDYIKKLPTSLDDVVWQFAIPYKEIKGNKLCQLNPVR